jgi:hypothetical protein
MKKSNKFRNSYDEDVERDKRFPWRSSFRRPMGGPSSMILIALMTAIYVGAAAVVFVADGRPMSMSRFVAPLR